MLGTAVGHQGRGVQANTGPPQGGGHTAPGMHTVLAKIEYRIIRFIVLYRINRIIQLAKPVHK